MKHILVDRRKKGKNRQRTNFSDEEDERETRNIHTGRQAKKKEKWQGTYVSDEDNESKNKLNTQTGG